jgi:hypothetical protein
MVVGARHVPAGVLNCSEELSGDERRCRSPHLLEYSGCSDEVITFVQHSDVDAVELVVVGCRRHIGHGSR